MSRLTKFLTPCVAIAFFAAGLAASGTVASAETDSAIARGGKLYDKWYKVIKADKPKDTHAAWPASNTKKKGDTTWRCKSCHGWDFMGADGAYAKGSYKTGIKGIRAYDGADQAKIVAVLKDDTHKLAGKMADQDFSDLALFVSKGQVDMDKFIDRASKTMIGGNAEKGAAYYNTMCAQCHAVDGSEPEDMGKTLGKLVTGNPWEIINKILNGQPAEKMPALRALDRQVTIDIMTHMATLPKEK